MDVSRRNFLHEQKRITALLRADPSSALTAARGLPTDNTMWRSLKASVLCDAGRVSNDREAVEEAVRIFDGLLAECRDDVGTFGYNLANALDARAQLDPYDGPDWYLRTASDRRRARALLGACAAAVGHTDARAATQITLAREAEPTSVETGVRRRCSRAQPSTCGVVRDCG
jgi:hypothetical protein